MRWGLMTSSHFGNQAIPLERNPRLCDPLPVSKGVGCLFGESPSRLSNKFSIGACKLWRVSRGKNARGCSGIQVTFL